MVLTSMLGVLSLSDEVRVGCVLDLSSRGRGQAWIQCILNLYQQGAKSPMPSLLWAGSRRWQLPIFPRDYPLTADVEQFPVDTLLTFRIASFNNLTLLDVCMLRC